MLALIDEVLRQFLEVVDLGHGYEGKASQVAVGKHGLGIGVADHAYSGVSVKLIEFVLKARPEVRILQVMNLALKMPRFIDGGYTAAASAEVKLIVCAVEYVGNAFLLAYYSKETAHCSLSLMLCE